MKRGRTVGWLIAAAAIVVAQSALATALAVVGNPPVFYEGNAGPYHLHVSLFPPDVIPGMARITADTSDGDVSRLRVLALPIDVEQMTYPPTPDSTERSEANPSTFTGQVWLMSSGSWEVRFLVDGGRGHGELAIPVPALPTHVATMPVTLAALLLGLLGVLGLGLVSIVAAAVREGRLPPGAEPSNGARPRTRAAVAVALAVVLIAVFFGDAWWTTSERAYARSIYRALGLQARLEDDGRHLELTLSDPGWRQSRKLDDLAAVEEHALELWMIELPGFERIWHLHPQQIGAGRFDQALPDLPQGRYALFARAVHLDGLTETARAEIDLPEIQGQALDTQETGGVGPPLGSAEGTVIALPNGGRLKLRPDRPPVSGEPVRLRFDVEDRQGTPVVDLDAMFGRRAEAVVLSADRAVFAALSTRGTVAPVAWQIANSDAAELAEPASSEIAFDYVFPHPGRYRLFIQIRRQGQTETGMLDLRAL